MLDSPDATGGISGIIALATDDMLHGGDQHHLDKMDILRTRYKLGKYTWGTGRFVGKDFILQADGSLVINQAFYVDEAVKPVTISRERKRRRFSPCTEIEITELRALIGSLAWLAKETRCDLAGRVALAQQAFPRPLVRDLIFANQIAADAVEHKDIGVHLMPIEFSRLRVGVVTDASWGNSKEMGAQLESTSLDTWKELDDCWIRVHKQPRQVSFHPMAAPDGPDIHTLSPQRLTVIEEDGRDSKILTDDWTVANSIRTIRDDAWVGYTKFFKLPSGQLLSPEKIHTGQDQLTRLFSQGGEMVIFYDEALPSSQSLQMVSVAAWKSYRLKRRTVNTLSSETQALVRGLGSVHWLRVLLLETSGMSMSARDWQKEVASLPFIAVTDSKSLYDVVKKCINPASQCEDKRTCIDVALVKQEMSELGGTIRWVDGRTMIADSLTKDVKAEYLRHILRSGHWSILEEGASLQRKLIERQGGESLVLWMTFG